ncbi:uncharacterized protein LOC112553038, partial [Pogonomyrmex barbatus]|uniref:Uncharacterized protein LOC112553038 n=1 Tax=Pogonomyrmex barbatus TaxID=144034 RepID=A0A8N1SBQ9_9HYME
MNERTRLKNYDWAIGLSRTSLKFFGVWPENNETKREKYISNIYIFLIINIAFCGCLIPSVHSLIKIWDILPLLNMIKNDWLKPKTANERDVMIKQARAARKLVPMQTYYIYDRDKSPLYEITFIVQSIGLSTVALVYTSTDSFLGLLIFHICGQLENLKACIIHLGKFSNFESGLSHIVQDH